MRKLFLVAIVIVLLTFAWTAQAAPPPEGPPGLAKALAAQIEHNPRLLTTPGVVGTAVGLRADGTAVVRVFIARPGVAQRPGLPRRRARGRAGHRRADGAEEAAARTRTRLPWSPSRARSTARARRPARLSGFAATALDAQEGDLSARLVWTSSQDGPLGTGTGFSSGLSDGTHTITASRPTRAARRGRPPSPSPSERLPSSRRPPTVWARPVPIGVSTGNYQRRLRRHHRLPCRGRGRQRVRAEQHARVRAERLRRPGRDR